MIARMLASSVIWITVGVMVITGTLRDRDLWAVLVAATLSTIAVWALQPAGAINGTHE
jgi:hypothetical protein